MDPEALLHKNFIPLKLLFPEHDVELNPNTLCLIISNPSGSTPFYNAKIGQFNSGISMEKSCIFPLFVNALSGKGQIPNLNASIIHEFEKKLSLTFVPEKLPDSNVCFANSGEVRPEFKSTFGPVDIFDYLLAILNSPIVQNDLLHVPYPKNDDSFWGLATLGRKLCIAQTDNDRATVSLIIENIAKIHGIDSP